jgi:hypothetical protein
VTGTKGPTGPTGPGVAASSGNHVNFNLVDFQAATVIDSIDITLPKAGDLLAAASVSVDAMLGSGANTADCWLTLEDNVIVSNQPVTGVNTAASINVAALGITGFRASVAAGPHTVKLWCETFTGHTMQASSYAIDAWEGAS